MENELLLLLLQFNRAKDKTVDLKIYWSFNSLKLEQKIQGKPHFETATKTWTESHNHGVIASPVISKKLEPLTIFNIFFFFSKFYQLFLYINNLHIEKRLKKWIKK